MFHLKNPKGINSAVIFLHSCSDGRLKYYTGISALVEDWPKVHGSAGVRLKNFEVTAKRIISDYQVREESLTVSVFKSLLDKKYSKEKTSSPLDFHSLIENAVDGMKTGRVLTPGKKRYSAGSIKTFSHTLRFWKEFNADLSAITIDTYYSFIKWCHEKDYSTNYIGSQIKNFKRLCSIVGIKLPDGFKKITELTDDIYLTEQEIEAMYNLQLSSRLSVARDWFVLDCYTGLRVSDLIMLSGKNFDDNYIRIGNRKTGERVMIPANKFVKQIISKYNGFPPAITDVEINRSIKLVAEKAGITGAFQFGITKGGKKQHEYFKKWQMVSCHTARRSFITNLIKQKVPEAIIMKLTGIKSHETLKRYNKMSVEDAAGIALEFPMFSGL